MRFLTDVALLTFVLLLSACKAPEYVTWADWHTPRGEGLLHSQFLEARAGMDEPYVLAGEDVERLYATFRNQLRHVGDSRFAAALPKEPPDVIAAVSELAGFASLGREFPQTYRIWMSVPKISFPAVKITEENRKRG